MIDYRISFQNPNTHIIDIEVTIRGIKENKLVVNLPSWRPGRYELANYAKNVFRLTAFHLNGEELACKKVSKDQWEVAANHNETIKLQYSYYAFQMDAGNSWLDDEQLYINPINCLIYIKERMNERSFLTVDIPASYKIATGLKEVERCKYIARDYYELSDSPLFASATLRSLRYFVDQVEFFIWIQGENFLDEQRVLKDFKEFSETQISMFGDFPDKEYHFMFQFLPYSFRHGVEHRNSTVITIGPSSSIPSTLYRDFLGISSHELFHAWNVLRIRPKELFPYDFSKENYYETGYITEGLTTYYGDLLLARSKVFTYENYFSELDDLFKRHFENEGNLNQSLAESSYDLWLDGYVPGTPGRKVSIYVKGAIVAFLIDITIRKESANKHSLDDVMRRLWTDFGKKNRGVEEKDIINIISELGIDINPLVKKAVYERSYLKKEIEGALDYLGLRLNRFRPVVALESDYGIRVINTNNKWLIEQISGDSRAIEFLSKGDEIIAINGRRFDPSFPIEGSSIKIDFLRGKRLISESLKKDQKSYFPILNVALQDNITDSQIQNFNSWIK